MSLVNISRELGGPANAKNGLHTKEFIGEVVDTDDPEKLQRVKIRSSEIHKEISDENLPWVFPGSGTAQANANGVVGHINVPAKGSKIIFRYEDDSMYAGRYYGTPPTRDLKIPDFTQDGEEYAQNYPNVEGAIDGAGNRSVIDKKDKVTEYNHSSGTMYKVDGKGSVMVQIGKDGTGASKLPGGLTLLIDGDANINVKGKATISARDLVLSAAQNLILSARRMLRIDCQVYDAAWASGRQSISVLNGRGPSPQNQQDFRGPQPRQQPNTNPMPANSTNY